MGAYRHDTDFVKIADDLRHASAEARRAALLDPANGETLRRKARDLEQAAARIEREADERTNFLAFNDLRG